MARYLSDAAKAAKEIRKELKAINVKAKVHSETYSGGDSINVYVENLNPELAKQVNDICNKYQMGHFDGILDYYEYSNKNNDLVAQVKYVFVNNNPSDEMIEKILNWLDQQDKHEQFNTDEKTKKYFSDYSMSRYNLARKIFRGYDFLGNYWKQEQAA